MNISLPDDLHRFVLERVEAGCYGSASEYIRTLIRRDRSERVELRSAASLAHPPSVNDLLKGILEGSAPAADPPNCPP